jgi:hypothetical protein
MSLDWNLTGIENHEELCFVIADEDDHWRGIKEGDRVLNPVTEGIIWLTMACDIGWGVTEENVEEFIARADLWQKVCDPMLYGLNEAGDMAPRAITADEIRAHIGLRTNVSYGSRAKFLEKVWRSAYPDQKEESGLPHWVVWERGHDGYANWEVDVYAKDEVAAKVKGLAEAVEQGYSVDEHAKIEVEEVSA